ncbi:YdcF family protein [Agriterribacter sp.]|uniref:YdcF family protein n=1 Tax=Agriterribacter sp. TaxID=2821509 RepID=UPI002CD9B005|nr:YdcF family protein [Agriterribacter sp.]HRO48360.1 YdcF family protein [Agriterribacter sp.]HRQ19561.1 YdcF family protein [Agriterribacter sp.]
MMFVISKLVIVLLSPVLWIVIVFVWAWLSKKAARKKRCYTAGIIMLLFFTNPFIISQLILAYQPEKVTLGAGENYSAGILLGGFAGKNKTDQQTYFSEQSDRFIQAALLYKTGHIQKIIVAAGDGTVFNRDTFREGDFIQQQLIAIGIPPEAIALDRDSRNTAENAANTKKIIDSLQLPPPYLLVTSAMHIPRAKKTFIRAGIAVIPYPAAFFVRPPDSTVPTDYMLPSANALKNWDMYLREITGSLMYWITGRG